MSARHDFFVVLINALPRETKVGELHVHVSRDQNIFAFQISMGIAEVMEVTNSADHLEEPQLGFGFWDRSVVLDEIEQIAVLRISHENEDRVTALKNAVNVDNIGVVDLSKQFELAREKLVEEIFRRFGFVHKLAGQFQSVSRAWLSVICSHNLAVRTFADSLPKLIAASL